MTLSLLLLLLVGGGAPGRPAGSLAPSALTVGALSYRSVDSILRTGLDRAPLPGPPPARPTRDHGNVRGPGYYE